MDRCVTCANRDDDMDHFRFDCVSCETQLQQCEWCRDHSVNQYYCPECDEQALVPFLGTHFASIPVINRLCLRLSMRRLEKYRRKETSIGDVLDTAFEFRGYGLCKTIEPWQRRYELRELVDRVEKRDPKVVLEIGTGRGGTFYTWCRALDPEFVISLDLPGGTYGGGYTESQTKLFRSFTDDAELRFLRQDSQEATTRNRVSEILGDRSIDFLYLDGDHSYEGVKRDFELYEPSVADGGTIALHDIDHRLNDDPDSPYGVKRFWKELEDEYRTEAILSEPREEAYGNGIVYL